MQRQDAARIAFEGFAFGVIDVADDAGAAAFRRAVAKGDAVLPVEVDTNSTTLFANAVRDDQAGEVILKVVNAGDVAAEAQVSLAGSGKVA